MRRGVRTGRQRPILAAVAMVCAVALVGVGDGLVGTAVATSAATHAPTSAGASAVPSACQHRIRHRAALSKKQLRLRKRRWAQRCRAAQAALAQAAAPTGAAAPGPTATTAAVADPRAATGAPAVACGTTTYLKPDGSAYSCSFSDEFTGSALDSSKWSPVLTAATGQRAGTECVVDTPDTLGVGGDVLTVTARRLDAPISCASPWGAFDTAYTGGMITTSRKFAQAYGRFEMRARFPQATGAGLQSALWMYPQTLTYGAWPASGEIDIAEWFSGWGQLAVPHLHYDGDATDPYRGSYSCQLGDPSAFHTFAVDWTPAAITFVYDGQICLRNSTWSPLGGPLAPAPFDQPFNLLIGNGRGTGNNAPTASTPFPSTLQVDYVRAWS